MRSFAATSTAVLLSLALVQPEVALAGEDQSSEPGKQTDRERRVEPIAKAEDAEKAPRAKAWAVPIYQLPSVGKPRRRVGGGRRGPAEELAAPDMYALVPSHVGRTVSAAPVLYWYLSGSIPEGMQLEFTVIDDRSIDPLVDVRLPAPEAPGVHAIRLADYGVELVPGTEYQWAVALVVDPDHRSRDAVATGWVERVSETSELRAQLRRARVGGESPAALYAQQGLWYDALASACERVAESPGDARLQSHLAELLEQAGLPSVSLVASH